jgi:hypothetical protein
MITALHIPDIEAWARSRRGPAQVAVVARDRVIEASEALREMGVETGESRDRITRRFPEAVLVEHDPIYAAAIREELCYELNESSPSIQVCHGAFYAVEIADINGAQRVAERLGVRAGWGDSVRIACLAALEGYPGLLNVVEPTESERFLRHGAISLLVDFGFDPEMVERLGLFGYRTLESLDGLTLRHLNGQFGALGRELHAFLHAEPVRRLPLWSPPQAIEKRYRFDWPVREPYEWNPPLQHLCREGVEELGDLRTSLLRIVVEEDRTGRQIQTLLPLKEPSNSFRLIFGRSDHVLANLDLPEFREISVSLGTLSRPEYHQPRLFEDRSRLEVAKENLGRRYPGSLLQFEELHPDAPLPEDRWHLVPI